MTDSYAKFGFIFLLKIICAKSGEHISDLQQASRNPVTIYFFWGFAVFGWGNLETSIFSPLIPHNGTVLNLNKGKKGKHQKYRRFGPNYKIIEVIVHIHNTKFGCI